LISLADGDRRNGILSSVQPQPPPSTEAATNQAHVRVLLLDDDPVNLHLRAAILRQHGYSCYSAMTVEEATELLKEIDIAVLDYHLGTGQFGTEVAGNLRKTRPEVPIIILSATLEYRFGGVEDMHLLKGHSSVDDLLAALSSFEARLRGAPVVVDARDFFYSRICMAIGSDVLVQVLDASGNWLHCNEAAADYLGQTKDWFPGRNLFVEMPALLGDWIEILDSVANSRETYIDRTRRGLFFLPGLSDQNITWSVLAFPIRLHDSRRGAVITARILSRTPLLIA
jgi:two-component system, OmpR family, response regulator